ncbi:MAG: TniQ family protein [Acidobacteria bacterium]|nr:TniQ family protein [Acidobacteriota bacterium]
MKPPDRWPVHPAPLDGEALSSWLRHIAHSYQFSESELLENDLGHVRLPLPDLDLNPPDVLLETLARRTGVTPDRVARMSLAGWTPWLLDALDPDSSAFETYVHQLSVLLPPGKRPINTVSGWRPWIPEQPLQRACPQCLADPGKQCLLLMWQLPLLLSCPAHGCLLKPCIGFPGIFFEWADGNNPPRPADEQIRAMDRLTWQGLTTGKVRLPRRSVHAGIWFRLLRTLVDELSIPLLYWKSHVSDLRFIWRASGHPVRAGQSTWRPFESCTWPIQAQLLGAAAEAINLLEAGTIIGRGTNADLFLPVPDAEIDDGRTPEAHPERAVVPRPTIGELLEAVVQAARENPADARNLYKFCLVGCRTPESVTQLRADFTALGLHLEEPSHTDDRAPFA